MSEAKQIQGRHQFDLATITKFSTPFWLRNILVKVQLRAVTTNVLLDLINNVRWAGLPSRSASPMLAAAVGLRAGAQAALAEEQALYDSHHRHPLNRCALHTAACCWARTRTQTTRTHCTHVAPPGRSTASASRLSGRPLSCSWRGSWRGRRRRWRRRTSRTRAATGAEAAAPRPG